MLKYLIKNVHTSKSCAVPLYHLLGENPGVLIVTILGDQPLAPNLRKQVVTKPQRNVPYREYDRYCCACCSSSPFTAFLPSRRSPALPQATLPRQPRQRGGTKGRKRSKTSTSTPKRRTLEEARYIPMTRRLLITPRGFVVIPRKNALRRGSVPAGGVTAPPGSHRRRGVRPPRRGTAPPVVVTSGGPRQRGVWHPGGGTDLGAGVAGGPPRDAESGLRMRTTKTPHPPRSGIPPTMAVLGVAGAGNQAREMTRTITTATTGAAGGGGSEGTDKHTPTSSEREASSAAGRVGVALITVGTPIATSPPGGAARAGQRLRRRRG